MVAPGHAHDGGGQPGVTYAGRVPITNERIVWIDCEMTGLDIAKDALIEVAVLVTDSELNILGEGVDVVIRPSQEALEGMDDFVREMHTASKLLDELPDGVTLGQAQSRVMEYIRTWVPEPRKGTPSGRTGCSSPATCPRSSRTCTTA